MPQERRPTVCSILSSSDKKLAELSLTTQISTHHSNITVVSTPSLELMKEIEHLKEENDVMKCHLSAELNKLRHENKMLKDKIKSIEDSSIHQSPEVPFLDASASKTHLPAAIDNHTGPALDLDETVIKKFNCLPKRLPEFFSQMEHGDEDLPKFTELSDSFKKNSRTKGTYSKRKAVLSFIQTYEGGVNACFIACNKMSSLQVYEQLIKKSRN